MAESEDATAQVPPHEVPAELRGWPRKVEFRTRGMAVGTWFVRLFILPHTAIGLGVTGAIVWILWWAVGAEVTSGRVTRAWAERGSHKVAYEFDDRGVRRSGVSTVRRERHDAMAAALASAALELPERPAEDPPVEAAATATTHAPSLRVEVRVVQLGPILRHKLEESPDMNTGSLCFLVPWAAFWNTGVAVALYHAHLLPWRYRRLVKYGQAATGRVTGKGGESGPKAGRVFYTFEFDGGRQADGEMDVTGDYAEVTIGQSVTVLHPRGRPRPSFIYEYGPYRARPGG